MRLEPGSSVRERKIVQLFLQPSDVSDPHGSVRFESNPLRPYARTRGLPVTPKAMTVFGRRIGDRYHVWGSSREHGGLYRAETSDGVTYENLGSLESPMAPEHLLSVTYNDRDGVYLALEREFGPSRFHAMASSDGIRFNPVTDRPAFVDHDGAYSTSRAACCRATDAPTGPCQPAVGWPLRCAGLDETDLNLLAAPCVCASTRRMPASMPFTINRRARSLHLAALFALADTVWASPRHLFLDPALLADSEQAELRVNPPQRNEMVITPDRPWEQRMISFYTFRPEGVVPPCRGQTALVTL